MKDTISYDLAHHQQQHQQQQQQHNPSSWNQQRPPQQTHSPSVYTNHHNAQQPGSQSRTLAAHQHQHQHHHHLAQLGQYSHQELQTVNHHNNNANSSAYYQQAHLYPGFQDQQQAGSPHQHHHHASAAAVTSSSATTSVLNAAVAAVTQQQHSNTQVSGLHHAGWSSNVGGLAAQAHHAVVTDHSALAYLPHAYQSHNSNVTEHSRTSTGLTNQPIGTGPQASSYAVDSLYNSPAAAAVAAYGYNNYNTAFFQTSNNGPHTQTGHPAQPNLSAFWNHNQTSQQHRTGHSQGVEQTSLQHRQQQLATDQSNNYMHDPRLYYMRPSYDQVLQNFSQNQTQITPNQQQQASELTHNRIPTLSQQQPLVNQQDLEPQRFEQVQQSQHHSLSGHSATVSNPQVGQQNNIESTLPSQQHATIAPNQPGTKTQAARVSPQYPVQKRSSIEGNTATHSKNQIDYEQQPAAKNLQSTVVKSPASQKLSANENDAVNNSAKQSKASSEADQLVNSQLSAHKTQTVMKNETAGQYQAQKQQSKTSSTSQVQSPRNNFRPDNEERQKLDVLDRNRNHREPRAQTNEPKRQSQNQAPASNQQTQNDSDLVQSVEDSLATLAIGSRKTTWASIASQPAKVAQPKSLKSKISGSNSVLSSAKHLTSSVTLDSSNLDSKNGINPAIKSSVSTAATSLQRSSVPPPISKINIAPKLNLDLLIDDGLGSSKISWPAVNASINLTLDDPPLKKESDTSNASQNERYVSREEESRKQDVRESSYRDHNHNQGPNTRMGSNNYNSSDYREPPNRDYHDDQWGNRRGHRDNRVRRDSDRKEVKQDERMRHEEPRNQRREYRPAGRVNNFRGDDVSFRDNKRGPPMDRGDQRGNNNYRFQPAARHEQPRDQQNRNNESGPHHHYSNLRDGNPVRDPQGKLDLNLHPHLNPANYNPKDFNCEPENARYFIIKSYSEDDIHRSIKYSIWCSTNHGNKRLEEAYRQQQATNGQIFLFFSVNGSGHFCGIAQMTSAVDFDSSSGVWAQSKWQGEFSVKWVYVKDVPNSVLRHITLENNEGKPVTNSRDTQEVPSENGKAVLSIIHKYPHATSLFDDFLHYERRQEEEKLKKSHTEQQHYSGRPDERTNGGHRFNRSYNNSRGFDFRDNSGNRDRAARFES